MAKSTVQQLEYAKQYYHSHKPKQEELNFEAMVPVPDYEGLYSIDKMGNVYSHHKYRTKFLKAHPEGSGYLQVTLTRPVKQRKNFKVHRLLAKCFLDYQEDLDVNHKDGNKLNNSLENLEMVTRKQNIHHAIALGLRGQYGNNR